MMTEKTITISAEAYEALIRLKRPGETLTDVILRLASRKSLLEFAGKWAGDPAELERAVKELRALWRRWATG